MSDNREVVHETTFITDTDTCFVLSLTTYIDFLAGQVTIHSHFPNEQGPGKSFANQIKKKNYFGTYPG